MAFSLSFPLRNLWKTTCLSDKAGMAFLGNKFLELLMSGAASGLTGVQWSLQLPGFHPLAAGYDRSDNRSMSFLYLQLGLNPASWLAIFCIYKQIFPSLCVPPTAAWEVHPVHRHCRSAVNTSRAALPRWAFLLPPCFVSYSYTRASSCGGSWWGSQMPGYIQYLVVLPPGH